MRNSIMVCGLSLGFFAFGYFFSGAIHDVRPMDNPPVIQENVQNEKENVRMVEGMQLVFMTKDGNMVFKRTMVPEGTKSVEDFMNYMQNQKRPSDNNVANNR